MRNKVVFFKEVFRFGIMLCSLAIEQGFYDFIFESKFDRFHLNRVG